MVKNVGKVDRSVRGIAGLALVLIGLLVFGSGPLAWILTILGVILVVTAVVGFCPMYLPFKINTNK